MPPAPNDATASQATGVRQHITSGVIAQIDDEVKRLANEIERLRSLPSLHKLPMGLAEAIGIVDEAKRQLDAEVRRLRVKATKQNLTEGLADVLPAEAKDVEAAGIAAEARRQLDAEIRRLKVKAAKENLAEGPATVLSADTETVGGRAAANTVLAWLRPFLGARLPVGLSGLLGGGSAGSGGSGPAGGAGAAGGASGGSGFAGAAGAAGAFGGGASVGALAGAAGLAGLAFMVVRDIQHMASSISQTFQTQAGNVARIDPDAVASTWAAGTAAILDITDKAGLLSGAFKTLTGTAGELVRGLDATAKRLSRFEPRLAEAQAMANVAQIMGDLRRAQFLGGELAEFTAARSRLSQVGQDTLAVVLKPIIPKLTLVLQLLADFLTAVGPLVESGVQNTGQIVNLIAATQPLLANMLSSVAAVAKNTRRDEALKLNQQFNFMERLLALSFQERPGDVPFLDQRAAARGMPPVPQGGAAVIR
jgi:hypothetical protein